MVMQKSSYFTPFVQGLYKSKAAKDRESMLALVDAALVAAGRLKGSVPMEEVDIFCKNARKLLVRFSGGWGKFSGRGGIRCTHDAVTFAEVMCDTPMIPQPDS